MFSNHNKTQSFEYRRNEFCHKILDALYFYAKPVVRESTYGEMMEGKQGTIVSNKLFPSLDISDFPTKFNEPDVFIQDCCEFLEQNKHVEPTQKRNDIIVKIKFTKLGVDAFKSDYYLKENQKQDWATELHKSTIFNNRWSTRIAILAFCISLFSLLKDCTKSDNTQQLLLQELQDRIKYLDSNQVADRATRNLVLTNYSKTFSLHKDTSKQNDTTR